MPVGPDSGLPVTIRGADPRKFLLFFPPNPFLRMTYDPAQVYSPEADTLLLLDAARAEAKPGDRVLEVGTGSGMIAAEVARITRVVATDINPHAVLCAGRAGVEVVRTDLFAGIRGPFDLVLFNPPYLPTQPEERVDDWLEYALDGGKTGRVVIERFARSVGEVLAPGGRVLLLISSLTGLSEVQVLFADRGYSSAIAVQKDVEDEVLSVLKIVRTPENSLSGSPGLSGQLSITLTCASGERQR
jgi:release factor glutamine methyltransferase